MDCQGKIIGKNSNMYHHHPD